MGPLAPAREGLAVRHAFPDLRPALARAGSADETVARIGASLHGRAALALLDQLRRHHAPSADHSIRVARVLTAMWHAAPDILGDPEPVLVGGALHDIGKLFVAAATLGSNRRLDAGELAAIRAHPETGAQVLRVLGFPPLVVAVARDHHERWLGGGYPAGCRSEQLHPVTRAAAVADAFVAMVEPGRAYRQPLASHAALAEILACRGTHFDPQAAEILVASFAGEPDPAGRICALN